MGTIVGIILTIIIAVISSRSGKKPHIPRFPAEQEPLDDSGQFEPFFDEDELDLPEEAAYTLETIPDKHPNLETYRPNNTSLEATPTAYVPLESATATNEYKTHRSKQHTQSSRNITQSENDDILKDFDLRKAVIYSEIMQPKFKQY